MIGKFKNPKGMPDFRRLSDRPKFDFNVEFEEPYQTSTELWERKIQDAVNNAVAELGR